MIKYEEQVTQVKSKSENAVDKNVEVNATIMSLENLHL